jgi:hypothetical protein
MIISVHCRLADYKLLLLPAIEVTRLKIFCCRLDGRGSDFLGSNKTYCKLPKIFSLIANEFLSMKPLGGMAEIIPDDNTASAKLHYLELALDWHDLLLILSN